MENGQDSKKKDKQIPEEELFDELDAMYQRVADIEKEEATEVLTHAEDASSSTYGTQVIPEKPLMKKSGRNEKRSYRPVILGAIAILFALILGITFWRPMAILQLLKIGDVQQPTVPPRPAPRKPPAVVTPKAPPAPPTAAASIAPPKPPSESVPAQTRSEAVKSPREEAAKVKSIPQEILKPDKPAPPGRYFAYRLGHFVKWKMFATL
jgi:hypothetical protein